MKHLNVRIIFVILYYYISKQLDKIVIYDIINYKQQNFNYNIKIAV